QGGCQACRYATRQDRRDSTGSSLAIRALRLKESRFRQARGTRSRLREAPLAENESEWPAQSQGAQYPRDNWQAAPAESAAADDGPPTAAQVPPTTPYVPPATPYGPPAAPHVPPAAAQVPPVPYVPPVAPYGYQ